MLRNFRLWLVLAAILSSAGFASHPDPYLQEVEALEIKTLDDPMGSSQAARTLLTRLNQEQYPRSWMRCWLLTLGENTGDDALQQIDRYLDLAQKNQLATETIFLLLKKAELHQSDWSKDRVMDLYEQAKRTSLKSSEPELYPRVLYELAY